MKFLLAALLLVCSTAQAQAPVRVLSGYPPGGSLDLLARLFSEKLAEALGRPVVVEARTGAGGQIAVQALRAAAPDGDTLLVMNDTALTLYPHTVKKPPFGPGDFTLLGHLGDSQSAIGVSANVPAADLREFVNWAKASPKGVSYASGAYGSNQHFMGILLAQASGANLVHVSYRGVGPIINDLAGGQLAAAIVPLGTLLPQAKAGKVRVLAHSGRTRSRIAPDVPTFVEAGYPTLGGLTWFGLLGPAGMRPEVVARYNDIVVQAARTPQLLERVRALDLEFRPLTPPELAALLKDEYERWGKIVKETGFSAEGGQ